MSLLGAVLVLAAVATGPPPPEAREHKGRVLASLGCLALAGDVGVTEYALGRPGFREFDPLMRPRAMRFGALGAGCVGLQVASGTKQGKLVALGVILLRGVAVGLNVRALKQSKSRGR